jgi:hypothetical protein
VAKPYPGLSKKMRFFLMEEECPMHMEQYSIPIFEGCAFVIY